MNYSLAERFVSINGEGQFAGLLAVFLRLPGCNLRCSYCDTQWANETDCKVESLPKEEILSYVTETGVQHVTVTGGEPLLQAGMADLLQSLSLLPHVQVEVETNGSVDLSPFLKAAPLVHYTMDYKLPQSGMESAMHLPNLSLLREMDTLKFVCGSDSDLTRMGELLDKHNVRVPIYLSPVFGQITPADMVDFMKDTALYQVRLQLQLHKFIWPPEQRGV